MRATRALILIAALATVPAAPAAAQSTGTINAPTTSVGENTGGAAIGGEYPYPTTVFEVVCGNPCFSAPAAMESSQRADLVARIHNADTRALPAGSLTLRRGVPPFSAEGLPVDTGTSSPFTDPESWQNGSSIVDWGSLLPPQQTAELTFSVRAPDVQSEQAFQEGFYVASQSPYYGFKTWNAVWDVRVFPKAPPVLDLVAPASATAGAPLRIAAKATDVGGVERVDFLLDDNEYGDSDTTAPYEAAIDTSSLEPGEHTLTAKAVDVLGLETTVRRTIRIDPARGTRGPTKLKRVPSDVIASGKGAGRRGVRISSLKVTAPTGSRISVGCVPRRCAPILVQRTVQRVTRVTFRTRHPLAIGTRVVVRVTKPGMIGEATSFRVIRNDLDKSTRAIR